MFRYPVTLETYAALIDFLEQLTVAEVRPGDYVVVKTCNSLYTLQMIGRNECMVSGGWFDRKGRSPCRTNVTGCTWGGSAIKIGIIAACGLRIEFANHVTTSEIRSIILFPHWSTN